MIGGRVALMLQPDCLSELSSGRRVVLVSGTNGKTTTTAMLTAAMATEGPVASNASGANMLDGLTTALSEQTAETVVGEVDELYLPAAATRMDPEVLVLLNLSRDQLDRAGELRETVEQLRALARDHPQPLVVANCDDPYVVFGAGEFHQVLWVSAGTSWEGDAGSCPSCGYRLAHEREGSHWSCRRCGLRRPSPDWCLSNTWLTAPNGDQLPVRPRLPGTVNRSNATMAVTVGCALGVDFGRAVDAVTAVADVAGRYRTLRVGNYEVRLLLAKNPAGWAAMLELLCAQGHPVVISVNAREADGRDTSWLYDVAFERLAGQQVVATGERAADVAVRLSYAEVTHSRRASPLQALDQLEPGPVLMVGDYTSFSRLCAQLEGEDES